MKQYLVAICLFSSTITLAQSGQQPGADRMPEPGYNYAEYITSAFHYPEEAIKHKIEGKAIVKFVVNKDGSISDVAIDKGVSKECDAEAVRIIKNMPPWKYPGIKDGQPVKVWFRLPVAFKLN